MIASFGTIDDDVIRSLSERNIRTTSSTAETKRCASWRSEVHSTTRIPTKRRVPGASFIVRLEACVTPLWEVLPRVGPSDVQLVCAWVHLHPRWRHRFHAA